MDGISKAKTKCKVGSQNNSCWNTFSYISIGKALDPAEKIDAQLIDGDYLILVPKRSMLTRMKNRNSSISNSSSGKKSLLALIDERTTHLPDFVNENTQPKIPTNVANNTSRQAIMLSLVKTFMAIAEGLQSGLGDDMPKENTENKDFDPYKDIEESSVNRLLEMGFIRKQALKALALNRLSPTLATEWLLKHSGSKNIEEDLTEAQLKRIWRQRERDSQIEIDNTAVSVLTAMGFDINDVVAALRIFNNDQQTACDWLIGDHVINLDDDDQDEFDDAKVLELENPLVKNMLKDTKIKAALNNPNVYKALKMITEKKSSIAMFIMDSEVSPVVLRLTQIIEISHDRDDWGQ